MLKDEERAELRALFIKEARKGAFLVSEGDVVGTRAAFCAHVQREFGDSVLTVMDALPYFRRKAGEQIGDRVPLASLLLYATWSENWVNVLIAVGTLRQGKPEETVDAYFAARPRFKDKVDHLQSLCGRALPERERGWLMQVTKTRARYHHYVWKGVPALRLQKDLKGIAALMLRSDTMITGLLAFEYQEFDAPLIPVSLALFPPAR